MLRKDLDELVSADRQPAVSIYLPTHIAGREIRQDPIRLRNLVGQADKSLAGGWPGVERTALLRPARTLIDDEIFWRHQEGGLALFLAPDFSRIHKLPAAVPEEVFVAGQFHILPLVPLIDSGQFWLLTLSAARTRLCSGTRRTLAEVMGLDLPQGVGEVRGESEYQETHHAQPQRRRGGFDKAQAFGDAPEEARKIELLELLRRVAAAVEPCLKRSPAPVVLAGHPEIRGHFREIAGWKELVPEGIAGNPDALAEPELHRRAWACAAPFAEAGRAAALDRLNSLLGTGKTATAAADIIGAAREGRVDTLFVGPAARRWGRIAKSGDIAVHEDAAEGDLNLFDYAALMTLRHGGDVAPVEQTALPAASPAAALLRY